MSIKINIPVYLSHTCMMIVRQRSSRVENKGLCHARLLEKLCIVWIDGMLLARVNLELDEIPSLI
jgi:hypothetical protein